MADVFLSYSRSDRAEVARLASVLENAGFSVWWDRHIDGGSEFSCEIEKELSQAGAVVVAWSESSLPSHWVRDEAHEALEAGKLVSISLDASLPPMGFRQVHTIDMQDGEGEKDLLRTVAHRLGEDEPAMEALDEAPPPGWTDYKPTPLLTSAVAVVLVAVLAAFVWWSGVGAQQERGAGDAPAVIAILPFEMSGDEEWQGRGDALTASLVSNLARLPDIELVSNTATRAALEEGLSPSEFEARLGADHYLEGTVQAENGRLIAHLRLIDSSSGRAIWSADVMEDQAYGSEYEALLLIRISGVLLALGAVGAGEIAVPNNLEVRAREAFIDGLSKLTTRNTDDWQAALRQMQFVTSLEPDFAAAHAATAYILAIGSPGIFAMEREDYLALHEAAMTRALDLDPGNHMATLARGMFALNAHGDIETGMRIAEERMESRPEDPLSHFLLAAALNYAGRPQEAITHLDHAIAADPFNNHMQSVAREFMTNAGDYRGVRQSAMNCRIDCWWASWQWWKALLRLGTISDYRADMEAIGQMADDERAFFTGVDKPSQSMDKNARFIILGDSPEMPSDYSDDGSAAGITERALLLFQYGEAYSSEKYIDDGFTVAARYPDNFPAHFFLNFLNAHRLEAPEAVRADPRYHAIFEIPRFKRIAEYRQERGLASGLPVDPARPWSER